MSNLILRSALLSLSKDARVSKDGSESVTAYPSFETPAAPAPQDEDD
jgi:hypothetical protein